MARITIRPSVDGSISPSISKDTFGTPEHMLLTEVPKPPEYFDEYACFWWTYYCGLMIECGTLSRMFIGTIINYCALASLIEHTEEKVAEQGKFIDVPKKYKGEEYIEEVINPLNWELRKMYSEFDRLACSLGMTPYSSKINAIDATGGSLSSLVSAPPPSDLGPPPETIPFKKEA